jgi:ATP-dependent RNA helicase RhlE
MSFQSLNLPEPLLRALKDAGYETPTPIQAQAIPPALEGRDLIGRAQTGTGKTAAFAIPIIVQLMKTAREGSAPHDDPEEDDDEPHRSPPRPPHHPHRKGHDAPKRIVRSLILTPTRELAVQIEESFKAYGKYVNLRILAVYGGVRIDRQLSKLRAGVDVIVATPGRLMDHMRQQNADLGAIELLVLDEADRMMDMGFWPDVKRIIATLPSARQTLLFSATMPDEVVRLALEIMREPKFVQVGQRSKPATSISHQAVIVPSNRKLDWLIDHLRRPAGPVLVFTRTKIGADRLSRQLAAAGIRCTALHADRSQDQRRAAVEGFRGGRYLVLVATDIAARGLDIDGIHTVINYEMPDSADAYVHRVGRTGRADEVGHAITLVLPDERPDLAVLEKTVGVRLECNQDG